MPVQREPEVPGAGESESEPDSPGPDSPSPGRPFAGRFTPTQVARAREAYQECLAVLREHLDPDEHPDSERLHPEGTRWTREWDELTPDEQEHWIATWTDD